MSTEEKLNIALNTLRNIKDYDSDTFEEDYYIMKEMAESAISRIGE